jgi:hypothetical protein
MPYLRLGNLRTVNGRMASVIRAAAVMAWPHPQDPSREAWQRRYLDAVVRGVPAPNPKTEPTPPEKRRMRMKGVPVLNDAHQIRHHTERTEYLAVRAGAWLERARRAKRQDDVEAVFTEGGGRLTLLEAHPWSVLQQLPEQRARAWAVAGRMLVTLLRLQYSPPIRGLRPPMCSVTKAAYLLAKQRISGYTNDEHIRGLWNEYKPVAHLCAAMVTWAPFDASFHPTESGLAKALYESTRWFFSGARAYELLALGLRDAVHDRPLIRPSELWRIPTDQLGTEVHIIIPHLDGGSRKLLKAYKGRAQRIIHTQADLARMRASGAATPPKNVRPR